MSINLETIKYDIELAEKDKEIERLNKENKELKEQVVSAIRVNNICTENKSIIQLQAQRYEQELSITKEKQLKEEIEKLNNIINGFGIWLLERKEFYKTKTGVENNIAFSFSKVAFDKLQELKENK